VGVVQTGQKCDILIYVVDSILGLEFHLDLHCIKKSLFLLYLAMCLLRKEFCGVVNKKT
jgi:hypothetical protein